MNLGTMNKVDSSKMYEIYDEWPEIAEKQYNTDFKLIEKVNKESERILSNDPELLDKKNEIIKNLLKNTTSSDISLG